MDNFFTQPICQEIWNAKYRHNNEDIDTFFLRQAKALAKNKKELDLFYQMLSSQTICLGGRIQYALGTPYQNQTLSNCYVVEIKRDSIDAIMETQTEFVKTMKAGGGVGCNFSILRPQGTKIRTSNGVTSGVVEFLKGFDAWCGAISAGNNRRGAMIAILDIWHPDIERFIEAKQSKGTLNRFNLSIAVTNDFMKAVKNNDDWALIFPDIEDEKYDELWDGNIEKWKQLGGKVIIYKTLPAVELYDKIMKANYEYAEPGLLFIDTINEKNPLKYCEYINATNPCSEETLAPYSSCNLGAINLTKIVKHPFRQCPNPINNLDLDKFQRAVRVLVRMLDRILDFNYYPLSKFKKATLDKRPIGVGIMGLGSMLNMLCVEYGSEESYEVANNLGYLLFETAYNQSATIAQQKGSFKLFDIKEFKTTYQWSVLDDSTKYLIYKHGLRNGRLLTIAPTGSTSIIAQNVSGGVEPLFALEYTRKVRQPDDTYKEQTVMDYSWWLYQKMFGQTNIDKAPFYFKATATNITPEQHIKMQAIWQRWIDASISKTINVDKNIPFEHFRKIYLNAWELGLKGCTTYRPNEIVGSILSNNQPKVLKELELKDREPAIRERVIWKNNSKLYIVCTINDKGYPLEVFAKLPKDAGNGKYDFERDKFFEYMSNWDAICRETSAMLRYGIPLEEIIKQLEKSSYGMFDCSAILARILKKYPITTEEDTLINKALCPECGGTMKSSSGCLICIDCGYSKCA